MIEDPARCRVFFFYIKYMTIFKNYISNMQIICKKVTISNLHAFAFARRRIISISFETNFVISSFMTRLKRLKSRQNNVWFHGYPAFHAGLL